jgi:transcriptional regulator with XRE-family HTH domain
MTIREMVIYKRNEAGLTQKELSEKTGIAQCRISEFESGTRSMNSDNIDKIFEALEIEFSQNKEQQWIFAKECAKAIKNKGISNIDTLTKEDIATLTGKDEILLMKEYNEQLYDEMCAKEIEDKNAYNYMKTLIAFHISLLK